MNCIVTHKCILKDNHSIYKELTINFYSEAKLNVGEYVTVYSKHSAKIINCTVDSKKDECYVELESRYCDDVTHFNNYIHLLTTTSDWNCK